MQVHHSLYVLFCITQFFLVDGRVQKRETNNCILPEHPLHGLWSVATGTNSPYASPGFEVPPGTSLNVQCQTGYKLQGFSFIICSNKVWSSTIGKCEAKCPPITSTPTTKVTCINPNDGKPVENCDKPEDGTTAKFKCAQFYENTEINENFTLVCQNGAWSHQIPQCKPVCGVKSVSAEPLIIGGSITKTTDYPWHVGIYQGRRHDSVSFDFMCGGTLINERVLLTVAHCLTINLNISNQSKPKPLKNLRVAVGKFYVSFNDSRDLHGQTSEIQNILINEKFKAESADLLADIAILITVKSFVLSKYVLPICMDWGLDYEYLFTSRKVNGSICGWGFTRERQDLSDELKELHVPYAAYDECSKNLDKVYDRYFTNDKMCAGYRNKSLSLCNGDAGGGLVFRNTDGKYYLVGIASFSPSDPDSGYCDSQQYSLYTKVSSYTTNFIFETEQMYRPQNLITSFKVETLNVSEPISVISKSRELCGLKNSKTETLIVGGKNTTKGDYPWQIAIYDTTKNSQLICGGSLIHKRVILTAAHCVTHQFTNELNTKEQYMLAAGKYFIDYGDSRDTHVQYSRVKEMFVPPQYEGENQNYMADIAILISDKEFTFSKYVQPVCIDWDNKYEFRLVNSSIKGLVSGWGRTTESGNTAEVLKDLKVPYVDRHQCKKDLPVDYDIYLTFDKICSGYLKKNISVCKGDSGGGLVFKVPDVDRYYITGIVSLSPRAPTAMGGCDSQQYTLYTRVSHYITSFILAKVRLFL